MRSRPSRTPARRWVVGKRSLLRTFWPLLRYLVLIVIKSLAEQQARLAEQENRDILLQPSKPSKRTKIAWNSESYPVLRRYRYCPAKACRLEILKSDVRQRDDPNVLPVLDAGGKQMIYWIGKASL